MSDRFNVVGMQQTIPPTPLQKKKWYQEKPLLSFVLLAAVIAGCFGSNWIMTKDPAFFNLASHNVAPNREFLFGTDTMGRDIFSMIWSGGKISLTIGFLSTLIATFLAVLLGTMSGMGPAYLDSLFMRITEILISIPDLLLIILLQAFFGKPSVLSLSLVIGITSWTEIAKVVRTEVRRIRNSDFVIASKCMGGSFFHVLRQHLLSNFISSILFMMVMKIRGAIIAESTLSFMGIGLPLSVISWGSMLSMADNAMLTNSWWMIWIPGGFLVTTLLCITNIGNYLRKRGDT